MPINLLWSIPLTVDLVLLLVAVVDQIRSDPRPVTSVYVGRHALLDNQPPADVSPVAAAAEMPGDVAALLAPTAIDVLRKLTPRWHDLVKPPTVQVFDGLVLPVVPGREVADGR
jgi:hypothetical protein